jgi:hypothetical protein
VDFFADPSRPRGWFDEPGDGNQGAKTAFGAARRERWFRPGV